MAVRSGYAQTGSRAKETAAVAAPLLCEKNAHSALVLPKKPHKSAAVPIAAEPIPSFDLPKYEPTERAPSTVVHKRRSWRKTAVRSVLALTTLVLVTGGALVWRGYSNFYKVFQGTSTVAALSTEQIKPELLKGEGDGRVNILLLGIGGPKHDGGDLTDTMMVLSVDPVNNTAAMVSIPRDLWVKMPVNYFGAYQKINAAYSSGKYKYLGKTSLTSNDQQAVAAGFAAANTAVSSVLGISISYHVLVNFQAFEQAVDTVNGVTLNVKDRLYDPTMAWENANNPVLAPVGLQTMNGKQALMYARSRETSSDFARSNRQRELLIALKEKILNLGVIGNPAKVSNLMDAFGSNVHTDLSPQAATRLMAILRKVDDTQLASLSLTAPAKLVTTGQIGTTSIVKPVAGLNNYSDIQNYVRSQLKDGFLVKEQAPVYVVASTEKLRASTLETLTAYGYTATASSTLDKTAAAGVQVINLASSASPYTLHYLQDRYGVIAKNELPANLQVPTGTQFVIITGT